MYIIGTPGTFLILLFKSLSQVATMQILCCLTLSTMQSSAQVPLCSHFNLQNLGSFAIFKAILYLTPNFYNQAITQSVMYGIPLFNNCVHFPKRQSIEALKISSLFIIEKLMKFVSNKILQGGPKALLCMKNRLEGYLGLNIRVTIHLFYLNIFGCLLIHDFLPLFLMLLLLDFILFSQLLTMLHALVLSRYYSFCLSELLYYSFLPHCWSSFPVYIIIIPFVILQLEKLRIICTIKIISQFGTMRRKRVAASTLKKISQIVPYQIATLFGQNVQVFDSPCGNAKLALNKKLTEQKVNRMKLTAAITTLPVLAGTQVSQLQKIIVLNKNANREIRWAGDGYKNPQDFQYYLNSKIVKAQKPNIRQQENISFPCLMAQVSRYQNLQIQYNDLQGKTIEKQLNGFQAFAFQQAYDFSYGSNIVNWRLHQGTLKVVDDVKQKLPRTTAIVQQFSNQILKMLKKFPQYTKIPEALSMEQTKWFQHRGAPDEISIETDYHMRIRKHYRKQMLLLLQKIQHNLV